MMTGGWIKNIAQWQIGKTLYLSVPFTWLLPKAIKLAQAHRGPVLAGGPAVSLMPDYLAGVALIGEPCPVAPLVFHNPLATYSSKGCPNRCSFCAIPRIEGDFQELKDWRPAPIVCDNNLLAASKKHFDWVIDRLKPLPFVDFNQGLEAKRLKPHHVRRLTELQKVKVRFAFDSLNAEKAVFEAITLCRQHGLKDFGVYVLIGFKDNPADARYRLEKVREWGIRPSPMRFQPLDALSKNSFVGSKWDERTLKDTMRYYSRLVWLGHLSFDEYMGRSADAFDNAA
ncbi:hypothetical protein LJB86_01965 [Deltaproteobacteria bacterium OttesenSCG-928-M10]|nr:hypothetical protein [Deltaproteobacteria bacterium OttesenSCG-928-M10]